MDVWRLIIVLDIVSFLLFLLFILLIQLIFIILLLLIWWIILLRMLLIIDNFLNKKIPQIIPIDNNSILKIIFNNLNLFCLF